MAKAPAVTNQPDVVSDIAPYINDTASEPELSNEMLVQLLKDKIKYVFVIFNENHSFDNEYGTLPGVNGLYSDGHKPRSAGDTPGFTQTYTDVTGSTVTVQPFRHRARAELDRRGQRRPLCTPGSRPRSTWSHGVAQMDQFAYDEYTRFASKGGAANIAEGHAVRPSRDVAHRLRHHPVLLAVGQPLHDLRQHLSRPRTRPPPRTR